ncbi:MAG: sugar phosphate isomerase/epimerase [Planctomycetes bacterium]|nr:sugar phosphate isomerase/epimerase [Planctomycetota bacterium]
MNQNVSRRELLAAGIGAMAVAPLCRSAFGIASNEVLGAESSSAKPPLFQISLAQWSLHRRFFDDKADPLDFARMAKVEFGIDGIEYVNQFFKDKAKDQSYLNELKKRAGDQGVTSILIMCDGEGALGDPDPKMRQTAVENHYKWVEAAKFLGCHSIRVNAKSDGGYRDTILLAADGLRKLTEFGAKHNIGVIVENHGGISSNGAWLLSVMREVNHPSCGTLPDFGNFQIEGKIWYDRYKGIEELMPFAKGVSAKSHHFDNQGNEIETDYRKMMSIVLSYGYRGWVGIEYEGSVHSEPDGIKLTKALLEKVRGEMAS